LTTFLFGKIGMFAILALEAATPSSVLCPLSDSALRAAGRHDSAKNNQK
jgi:hypothetical protein